jgi:hypothetical protein
LGNDEVRTPDCLIQRVPPDESGRRELALLLFPGRRIGTFGEGAEASLVALEVDPLKDLSALRRPRLAIKQSELLSSR